MPGEPARPLSSDMTDLDAAEVFAELASRMRRSEPQRLEMSRWRSDPVVRAATENLRSEITSTGIVTEEQMRQALSGPREAFTMLRAIDQAFGSLDPYAGSRNYGRLWRYVEVLREVSRYNMDSTNGSVIPRRSFPTRPQQVPDHEAEYLFSLMLVSGAPETVCLVGLEARDDFPEHIRHKSTIIIGCVPFLGGIDELNILRIEDADQWYSIRARTDGKNWEDYWQQRIEQVLLNLDHSNAHIGVLPELALTDQMLSWWRTIILRTPRPKRSRLEWILVGTGPITVDARHEQQPNRAVVLHRNTGRVIFQQDKCEPFTLTEAHIRDWQLAPYLKNGPLAEWMRDSRSRYVVDTRVGRLAILVCEDHDRLLTVGAELAMVAPTLLLIPIFAPPILRHRWQEQDAEKFANTTGSVSVVATSYAIKVRPHRGRSLGLGESGSALALVPVQRGPSDTWSAKSHMGDANGDTVGVVRFRIPRC